MSQTTKFASTLSEIRKMICMSSHQGEMTLHETALANEYGMSRTPIRQILQRLSYERLVFTKSGVGTVVTPLLDEERDRDFSVFRGLIHAALMQPLPNLSVEVQTEILSLRGIATSAPASNPEMQFSIHLRLNDTFSDLILDPILRDAFAASYWRVIRWHMKSVAANPIAAFEHVSDIMGQIDTNAPLNAQELFLVLAKLEPTLASPLAAASV